MTQGRPPLRAPVLVVAAVIAIAAGLAALTGGDWTLRAIRALAVVAFLGAIVVALERRVRAPRQPAPGALTIGERLPLGRESGVAVVTVAGRRILVGYGPREVRRLAEIGPDDEELRS